MEIYTNIFLISFITIYVVDLSGFTESWRSLLASLLHIRSLRALPPFDCGKCMTWWVCIIYAAIMHRFCLETIAFSSLLSFLSIPIGQVMIFIREGLISLTNRLIDLCSMKI